MTCHLSRIAFALVASASLAACAQSNAPEPGGGERPLAAEGEFCGGIAGIACAAGLTCDYDGDYPDAGGTCIPE